MFEQELFVYFAINSGHDQANRGPPFPILV